MKSTLLNCVKETKLMRGWACVVEGEYVPEGALVVTKPESVLEAYVEELRDVFLRYLEDENLAENTVVITDGKGRAYVFKMPKAKFTVVHLVDSPEEEAEKLVGYFDATGRGFMISREARALLSLKAGRVGMWTEEALPAPKTSGPVLAKPAAALPEAVAEDADGEYDSGVEEEEEAAEAVAVPARLEVVKEAATAAEEEARGGAAGADAEALCRLVRGDAELRDLVWKLVEVYKRRPELAKAAVAEAWTRARGF